MLRAIFKGMDGATTATGRQIPCNTTENLCSEGIWPASNMNAFYSPSAAVDHQAWFGSLTTGNADASGLMYMRNRYYNPQTGTFTQPDPIGIAGGLNVYGYADGDPVTYSDPMGLCPCANLHAKVGRAGAGAGASLTVRGQSGPHFTFADGLAMAVMIFAETQMVSDDLGAEVDEPEMAAASYGRAAAARDAEEPEITAAYRRPSVRLQRLSVNRFRDNHAPCAVPLVGDE
jgi:RHS repeat-associated protein